MKRFLFLAHGEPNHRPEAREAHRLWWEAIQGSVVDSGNPLVGARHVQRDGSVSEDVVEPAIGYTIVEAESMEDAIALLDLCPMDMWVYEAVPM